MKRRTCQKKVKHATTVEQQQKIIDEYVRQLPMEDIDDHMVLCIQHLEYLKEKRFNLNNIHQVYQSDDTQENQHMQRSKTVDQSMLEEKVPLISQIIVDNKSETEIIGLYFQENTEITKAMKFVEFFTDLESVKKTKTDFTFPNWKDQIIDSPQSLEHL